MKRTELWGPRICPKCSKEFTPSARRGPPATYCSEACRYAFNCDAKKVRIGKKCKTCDKEFTGPTKRLYCSPKCCMKRWKVGECQDCHVSLKVHASRSGTRCRKCATAKAYRTMQAALSGVVRGCPACGQSFTPKVPDQKFCSKRCLDCHHTREKRVRHAEAYVEEVSVALLIERDGTACALCGEQVDLTVSRPDPRSATIDHVKPLSKGGEHSMANTQLAHYGCNSSKGNRTEDEPCPEQGDLQSLLL